MSRTAAPKAHSTVAEGEGFSVFRLLMLAMAALLAACAAVGPNYQRPADAAINGQSANGPWLGGSEAAFVREPVPGDWWRLYESPTLDGLVQEALAANTDLRIAAGNIERALAGQDYADAGRRPSTSLLATTTYGRRSAEEELRPGKPLSNNVTYGLGAGVSYQVDLFGQIARTIESAQADSSAARAAYDATRVTVVAETTRAFLDACLAGREIAVATRSVALQEKSAELTQALFRGGRGNTVDVTRASAQVDQVRASLPALNAQRRLALYRLAVLTGKAPEDFPRTVQACEQEPGLARPIPIGDGAGLLSRRPDIRRAEFELHSATARIGIATADLYPKVTLGASLGSAGLGKNFLDADTFKFSIGPLINWQFPDRSRIQARIRSADADQQVALARFDGTVLNALKEAESALEVYARDLERRALLEAARQKARRASEDTQQLFALGRQGYLPVLDADRTLTTVEQSVAAADSKLASDQVNLFLALGGGWENR
ncbi:efflux transporter outer membrane subunit [Variovorax sp. WS11]|uniref:efflux transporter outer membrane subunit n=1 Tax=Variovorax sp. WS11 TaxID=1105204 RepID=UPI001EF16CB6|nr:efflux transporter outer membrane subunit [Variovorax sp. WS11]